MSNVRATEQFRSRRTPWGLLLIVLATGLSERFVVWSLAVAGIP
ncbi:hypothetical protein [Bradyrhizobium sp.]|nr:hypothetical protein [Bradyrhizobium sp.]